REPAHFGQLGERLPAPGAGRPLDLEGVALQGGRVAVALEGPRRYALAGFLRHLTERDERGMRGKAGFLAPLAHRGGERFFRGFVFALGQGPGAGVLAAPPRAAGPRQEHLERTAAAAI